MVKRIDVSEETVSDLGFIRNYLAALIESYPDNYAARRALELAERAGDRIAAAWFTASAHPCDH